MSDIMDFFMGRKALRKASGEEKPKEAKPTGGPSAYSPAEMRRMAEEQAKRERDRKAKTKAKTATTVTRLSNQLLNQ